MEVEDTRDISTVKKSEIKKIEQKESNIAIIHKDILKASRFVELNRSFSMGDLISKKSP